MRKIAMNNMKLLLSFLSIYYLTFNSSLSIKAMDSIESISQINQNKNSKGFKAWVRANPKKTAAFLVVAIAAVIGGAIGIHRLSSDKWIWQKEDNNKPKTDETKKWPTEDKTKNKKDNNKVESEEESSDESESDSEDESSSDEIGTSSEDELSDDENQSEVDTEDIEEQPRLKKEQEEHLVKQAVDILQEAFDMHNKQEVQNPLISSATEKEDVKEEDEEVSKKALEESLSQEKEDLSSYIPLIERRKDKLAKEADSDLELVKKFNSKYANLMQKNSLLDDDQKDQKALLIERMEILKRDAQAFLDARVRKMKQVFNLNREISKKTDRLKFLNKRLGIKN